MRLLQQYRATPVVAVVLCIAAGGALSAQRPEFEVASVKFVDVSTLGNAIPMNIGSVNGTTVTFGNAMLRDCIRFAYDIPSDVQIDGPDWIKSYLFLYDIIAKGAPGSSRADLQLMMRTLLAERFKLVVHNGQKEMSYYALVTAKNGPKMRAFAEVPEKAPHVTTGGHIDNILPMTMLAYLLSRFETERPILDRTGLSGMYETKLDWKLARQLQTKDDGDGPSLFTAVEEQLGLKLEARKGAVDTLIVDSAEKIPTEN
jgi:uncharacterized protein (TIGR03435 family)